MKRKIYLSNILRHWPLDAQRKVLRDVSKPFETYEDVLKPSALKAHSPGDLKERAQLLRPTARKNSPEIIYVASLGVLAWVAEDFMSVLAAAGKRNAILSVRETGTAISPTADAAELAKALSEFLAARRRHQTTGGRLAGVEASRAVRTASSRERAALIADDWHKAEIPTDVLLKRAGRVPKGKRDLVPMAWATAVRLLGRRPTQRKFDAAKLKERKNA